MGKSMEMCYHCMNEAFQDGHCSYCGKTSRLEVKRPEALWPGAMLQKKQYLLGNVLGGGGFGITYIGLDTKNGYRVAIKEFFPRGACTRLPNHSLIQVSDTEKFSSSEQAFFREARTLKRLTGNPGIVRLETFFRENQTAYIVMELLEGKTLRQIVTEKGGLSFGQACEYLIPASEALSYIHSQKVLHRDISPDNIYICDDGSVKLIDFGASYVNSEEFTQTRPGIKKRGFSPPEQNASEKKQGPWMDVYAMTACLYYCLAGQNPPDITERLYADDPLVFAIKHFPRLNGTQRKILLTGLQTDYTLRYPDGQAFYEALYDASVSAQTSARTDRDKDNSLSSPKRSNEVFVAKAQKDISTSKTVLSGLLKGWTIEAALLTFLCCCLYDARGLPLAMLMTFVLDTLALAFSREVTIPMLSKNLWYTSQNGMPLSLKQVFGISFINALYPLFLIEILCAIKLGSGYILFLKKLDVTLEEQLRKHSDPKLAFDPSSVSDSYFVPPADQDGTLMLVCEAGAILGTLLYTDKDEVRIGRDPEKSNFVISDDRRISGLHCRLWRKGREYWIEDLKSSNGTYVNRQRIYAPQQLHKGDSIRIGGEYFAVVTQPNKR